MKKVLFVNAFFLCFLYSMAQHEPVFKVEVSSDSVLLGNSFMVKFILKNVEGEDFEPPQFDDFIVVSGPNMTSSFSMVNGVVSQSVSYSYYLEPTDIGDFYILPANIKADNQILETEPIEILVVPNPDGIEKNPERKNHEYEVPDFKIPDFEDIFPEEEIQKEEENNKNNQPEEKKKVKKKRKIYKL